MPQMGGAVGGVGCLSAVVGRDAESSVDGGRRSCRKSLGCASYAIAALRWRLARIMRRTDLLTSPLRMGIHDLGIPFKWFLLVYSRVE